MLHIGASVFFFLSFFLSFFWSIFQLHNISFFIHFLFLLLVYTLYIVSSSYNIHGCDSSLHITHHIAITFIVHSIEIYINDGKDERKRKFTLEHLIQNWKHCQHLDLCIWSHKHYALLLLLFLLLPLLFLPIICIIVVWQSSTIFGLVLWSTTESTSTNRNGTL